MRLFLDTDVLVDVATDRQPHSEHAAFVLDQAQKQHRADLSAWVSWTSFLEFSQLASPAVGVNNTAEFCTELCEFLRIAHPTSAHLRVALAFNLPEFRATLQVAAAIACKADVIVTRNYQSYPGLRIPVKPPSILVEQLTNVPESPDEPEPSEGAEEELF